MTADEALWDAQFAAINDDKFAALVASVEAEKGKTRPMFDKRRELIENKPLIFASHGRDPF